MTTIIYDAVNHNMYADSACNREGCITGQTHKITSGIIKAAGGKFTASIEQPYILAFSGRLLIRDLFVEYIERNNDFHESIETRKACNENHKYITKKLNEYLEDEDNEYSFNALVIREDGIREYNNSLYPDSVNTLDKYTVIGSGTAFAMGALAAGCTPQQAVEITSKFDHSTGGKVRKVHCDFAKWKVSENAAWPI